MARQLYFKNQAMGTYLLSTPAKPMILTPPGLMRGLFATKGAVASDSKNRLYRVVFTIALKADDEIYLAEAITAIGDYFGESGRVEVRDGGSTRFDWSEAWMEDSPPPDPADGFGGRLLDRWPLSFVSHLRPVFS